MLITRANLPLRQSTAGTAGKKDAGHYTPHVGGPQVAATRINNAWRAGLLLHIRTKVCTTSCNFQCSQMYGYEPWKLYRAGCIHKVGIMWTLLSLLLGNSYANCVFIYAYDFLRNQVYLFRYPFENGPLRGMLGFSYTEDYDSALGSCSMSYIFS